MLWARSRRASVYLSRWLVLVRTSATGTVEAELSGDASMDEALARVSGILASPANLTIHLSAAFCPAIGIEYPEGVHRYKERVIFSRSVCAARLDVAVDAIEIALDPSTPKVAAPVLSSDWRSLAQWASEDGHRLSSVSPLWSVASRAQMMNRANSYALHEPDSVTLVGAAATEPTHAMTLRLNSADQSADALNRMHQALGLDVGEAGPRMQFGRASQELHAGLPNPWKGYWSLQ